MSYIRRNVDFAKGQFSKQKDLIGEHSFGYIIVVLDPGVKLPQYVAVSLSRILPVGGENVEAVTEYNEFVEIRLQLTDTQEWRNSMAGNEGRNWAMFGWMMKRMHQEYCCHLLTSVLMAETLCYASCDMKINKVKSYAGVMNKNKHERKRVESASSKKRSEQKNSRNLRWKLFKEGWDLSHCGWQQNARHLTCIYIRTGNRRNCWQSRRWR